MKTFKNVLLSLLLALFLVACGGGGGGGGTAAAAASAVVQDDSNQAPTSFSLSSTTIVEHNDVNDSIGNVVNIVDADSTSFTYSLITSYADNSYFRLYNNNLRINTVANFTNKPSYAIRININDGDNNLYKDFTINVTDVNESGSNITNIDINSTSINENTQSSPILANSVIGDFNATGGVGPFVYTFNGGSDDASFSITGSTLKINSSPDYEVKNSYTIEINAEDTNTSFSYHKSFIITINDLVDTAVFTITNISGININQGVSLDYSASVFFADGNITVATHVLPTNFSGISSTVVADNNITLFINETMEDEDVGSHEISFKVLQSDGYTATHDFNVTINDVNDAPINNTVLDNRTIAFNTDSLYNFNINDGDINANQNVTVKVLSSNLNVVNHDSTRVVTDSTGTFSITFNALDTGVANISVILEDDGGTLNNNNSYLFVIESRANGNKIYEDNNISAPTTQVTFDDIVYDWNATTLVYETNTTILLPIKFLDGSNGDLGLNVNVKENGHYDVNKSDYIYDDTIYGESATETFYAHESKTFPNALNGSEISAIDGNFAHDRLNKLFVSSVSIDQKSYNSFQSTNYCEVKYGTNWRLASALDIENNDLDSLVYGEYLGAYVGNSTSRILTSSIDSNNAGNALELRQNNAGWFPIPFGDAQKFRCVYNK